MDKISVTQRLESSEYILFAMGQYFKRPLIIFLNLVLVFLFVAMLKLALENPYEGYTSAIPILVIIVLLPILVYYSLSRNFSSNYALHAVVHYQFSHEDVKINSDKFQFTQSWDLVSRVVESRNWLLIYNSRSSAMYLKKESFEDLSDLEILKSIIRSKSGIRQKLQK